MELQCKDKTGGFWPSYRAYSLIDHAYWHLLKSGRESLLMFCHHRSVRLGGLCGWGLYLFNNLSFSLLDSKNAHLLVNLDHCCFHGRSFDIPKF